MTGFAEWAARHASIFGLTFHEDTAMFAAWEGVFEACGYSVEELQAATSEIAASTSPPSNRAQHLAEINRIIRTKRRNLGQANEDLSRVEEGQDACETCRGCGFVIVPHLKCVVDGVWQSPFWTGAVTCFCVIGQRREHSNRQRLDEGKSAPGSLTFYESRNPNWRRQMESWDEQRRRMVLAIERSVTTDQLLSRVAKKIPKSDAIPD